MNNLRWISILFFGVMLLFTACKKDSITNSEDVKLKRYTVDSKQYDFVYNGDLLTAINYSIIDRSYTNTYEFTYKDNKLVELEYKISDSNSRYLFFKDHNSYNMPTRAEFYMSLGDIVAVSIMEYIYNGNKLTEVLQTNFDKEEVLYTQNIAFTYKDDNVVNIYSNLFQTGSDIKSKVEDYEFDNGYNPGLSLRLFANFNNTDFDNLSLINKNNVVKNISKDDNGNIDISSSFNYVYEYNDKGFPTKCVKTNLDGSEQIIMKYEY